MDSSRYFSHDAVIYPLIAVFVFGIFGNTLVIISILRQRRLLRNNYYFLVFHLAICDLVWLLVAFFIVINFIFTVSLLNDYSVITCLFVNVEYVFQVAGIGMMLIISLLRYRATVHPLKPAISRRKLKVVCGLVYIVGFIAGFGPAVPFCFVHWNDVLIVYHKIQVAYFISCFYIFPTTFMAVVYYKICRALNKQNGYIKSVCSNPVRRSTPSSSFSFLRYIRHRRTFLVCLSTVLCYGLGNIPISVWFIWYIAGGNVLLYVFTFEICYILRLAGSHSLNPLIYGILDKKLLTFWKLCRKKKRRPQEN